MKQYEAVIITLDKLGGQATLGELNREVMKIQDCTWRTKTPFASIRRIVQVRPEIFKVRPGLWALRAYKSKLGLSEYDGTIPVSEKEKESSHSYYQGLLAQIGNLRNFLTFIPNQDKNHLCGNKPLGEIRSINELPSFSHIDLVKKSASIDVIWFNSRKMPSSFFEVEHSTDIQNSLLKFFELQDFHSRMIIVADELRKREFEQKIKLCAMREIADRVNFLGYDTLVRQYEEEVFKSLKPFVI